MDEQPEEKTDKILKGFRPSSFDDIGEQAEEEDPEKEAKIRAYAQRAAADLPLFPDSPKPPKKASPRPKRKTRNKK